MQQRTSVLLLLFAAIVLADLNQWTWINGHSDVTDTDPEYGTLGEANITNHPGARYYASSAVYQQHLYLYAGWLMSETVRNDMWMYDPVTELWTWVAGSSLTNQPTASTVPGARYQEALIATNDLFYIHGGR